MSDKEVALLICSGVTSSAVSDSNWRTGSNRAKIKRSLKQMIVSANPLPVGARL
jgi:hypothetical protein